MPNDRGPAAQGSDSETVRVLRAARAKIELGWCRLAIARDAGGQAVHRRSPDAVAWCASGAISFEAGDHGLLLPHPVECFRCEAVHVFREVLGGRPVAEWNDAPGRTKDEVLAAFDKAIALAREPAAGPSEAPPKESK